MDRPWMVSSGVPPRIRLEEYYPVVTSLPKPICEDLARILRVEEDLKARVLPNVKQSNGRDPLDDVWVVAVSHSPRKRAPSGYAKPRRR